MPFKLGNEDHYEPREVATVLNKNYSTVLRYIRNGDIQATKVNSTYLISHSELASYLTDVEKLPLNVIPARLSNSKLQTPTG